MKEFLTKLIVVLGIVSLGVIVASGVWLVLHSVIGLPVSDVVFYVFVGGMMVWAVSLFAFIVFLAIDVLTEA